MPSRAPVSLSPSLVSRLCATPSRSSLSLSLFSDLSRLRRPPSLCLSLSSLVFPSVCSSPQQLLHPRPFLHIIHPKPLTATFRPSSSLHQAEKTSPPSIETIGDSVEPELLASVAFPAIAMSKRVVLVRHGQSTWNEEGRIQGSSDYVVLTQKGEAPAETSRQMLLTDTFHGHRFGVLCLVAVERLLLSGSEDTTIQVWREEGSGFHTCLVVIKGHRGPVKCMAVCLEMEKVVMGLLVYSASSDRTVKVWRIMLFHEEKKEMGWEEDEVMSDTKKLMESEVSPVLSPKWVEKKLIA